MNPNKKTNPDPAIHGLYEEVMRPVQGRTVDSVDRPQVRRELARSLAHAAIDTDRSASPEPPSDVPNRPAILLNLHPLDVIDFKNPCPSCGNEAKWIQEREDTRLVVKIFCTIC